MALVISDSYTSNSEVFTDALIASDVSYSTPHEHSLTAFGFQQGNVIKDVVTGTYVLCAVKEGSLFIAFRGTDSKGFFSVFKDVITDVLFCKQEIPYEGVNPNIRVHSGFLRAYKSVRAEIHKFMVQYEGSSVVVTGHSLGGALATLAAVDLHYNFKGRDYSVLTFGSPRVGNKTFAASYSRRLGSSTLRVKSRSDMISCIPPKCLGYKHVGQAFKAGPFVLGHFLSLHHHHRPYYLRLFGVN